MDARKWLIGVIIASAVALIVVMGQTWYSWQIPETQGAGDVPAWNAWPEQLNHAYIVAGLAIVAALVAVVGIASMHPRVIAAGAVAAAGAVIGVVWLIVEPYDIPMDTTQATFEVAIQSAAWLGLTAALVLLAATLYAALERPAPSVRGRAALVSAVVLGALLFAAVSAFGHVRTTGRYQFATSSPDVAGVVTCGKAEAWVSEGAYNRGKMESDTWSLTSKWVYPPQCSAANGKPGGTLNTRAVYQVRVNGNWQGCDASNLQYNNNGSYKVQMERNYQKHPCGSNHYYRTQGYHGYKRSSGWINVSRASPDHYFG